MKCKPESQIKTEILEAIGALPGVLIWNHPSGCGRAVQYPHPFIHFGLPGSPDIIGCINGRALGIECKTAKGRLRPDQLKFREAWIACGGIYIVGRDAETVLNELQVLIE